jgi:hypothetical protein
MIICPYSLHLAQSSKQHASSGLALVSVNTMVPVSVLGKRKIFIYVAYGKVVMHRGNYAIL